MKKDNRSPFAERLIELRKKAHLRQEDVAEKLNLCRTAYTKYENDRAEPDKTRLMTLAEMFGVTVGYLVGAQEDDQTAVLADPATDQSAISLTAQELELIASFRRLPPEKQDALLQTGRALIEQNRKEK
jgi:transcriptional regulator with XRE-family HTH domain